MPNDVKLQEGHPVDENLRPLKVGGKSTAIETAQYGDGAKVTGNLEVTDEIIGNDIACNILKAETIRDFKSSSLIIDDSADITLDAVSDISLTAGANHDVNIPADVGLTFGNDGEKIEGDGTNLTINSSATLSLIVSDQVRINSTTTPTIELYNGASSATHIKLMSILDTGDYCQIKTTTNGVTTITTVDDDGRNAHLNIEPDGHVEFDNCAVGFDKLAGAFGTSAVIGSPNDGTDIDFRAGNKYELILTDNMGSDDLLNLIFPDVTGNFILVLIHDPSGGYDIDDAAWKAYASDGSLADSTLSENGTDGEVRWAGGATPTLSANGRDIDIISIYWDADEQTALAVASLDFASV